MAHGGVAGIHASHRCARALRDIGRMDASESKVIPGAAVVDDVLGLIVLGLVHAADAGNAAGISLLSMPGIVGNSTGFLLGSVLRGRALVAPLIKRLHAAQSRTRAIVHNLA